MEPGLLSVQEQLVERPRERPLEPRRARIRRLLEPSRGETPHWSLRRMEASLEMSASLSATMVSWALNHLQETMDSS